MKKIRRAELTDSDSKCFNVQVIGHKEREEKDTGRNNG